MSTISSKIRSSFSTICCCLCNCLQKRLEEQIQADRARKAKQIMKKYSTQLTKAALRKGGGMAAALASSLYNNNFIHDRYFKELIKTGNKTEPEVELVYVSSILSAVRRLVYRDPGVFPLVIRAFKQHQSIKPVAVKMESDYYNNEDILKVLLLGLSAVCGFVIIAIILALLIWYYVTTPTSGCLRLSPIVHRDILHSSRSSIVELNIELLNTTCREHLDQYPDFMTSCYINSSKDPVVDSKNSNDKAGSQDLTTNSIDSSIDSMTNSINSNNGVNPEGGSKKDLVTDSINSYDDIAMDPMTSTIRSKDLVTDPINSNNDVIESSDNINSKETKTDTSKDQQANSIISNDDIVPKTGSIYNSTCIVEAILSIESSRSSSCVQRIVPVLSCLGVNLNVTELENRTSGNCSNTTYILDKTKSDL